MPYAITELLELLEAHPLESLGVGMFVVLYFELMFCGPKIY